jgi:hypothetical protein
LKALLDAIVQSSSSIGNIFFLAVSLWFIASIIGMQVFKGTFTYCSNEDFPAGHDLRKAAYVNENISFPFGCTGQFPANVSAGSNQTIS